MEKAHGNVVSHADRELCRDFQVEWLSVLGTSLALWLKGRSSPALRFLLDVRHSLASGGPLPPLTVHADTEKFQEHQNIPTFFAQSPECTVALAVSMASVHPAGLTRRNSYLPRLRLMATTT